MGLPLGGRERRRAAPQFVLLLSFHFLVSFLEPPASVLGIAGEDVGDLFPVTPGEVGCGPRIRRGLGLVPRNDDRGPVRGASGCRDLAPEAREDGWLGWLGPPFPGELGELLASPAARVSRLGLGLRAILPAEVAVPRAALVQRQEGRGPLGQGQEGRGPLGQAVLTQAGGAGVVAGAVEKTGMEASSPGIAMDVAERFAARTWSSLANPER